jgi:hypothetical protein
VALDFGNLEERQTGLRRQRMTVFAVERWSCFTEPRTGYKSDAVCRGSPSIFDSSCHRDWVQGDFFFRKKPRGRIPCVKSGIENAVERANFCQDH